MLVPEARLLASHGVVAKNVDRPARHGAQPAAQSSSSKGRPRFHFSSVDKLAPARQSPWPATGGGGDCHPLAFPVRCASSRGTSRPVAALRSATAFTLVSWAGHQCERRTSPTGSSTLPVRVHLASGSRAGVRRALRASSCSASMAKGKTSCRSQPSSGSARARNCMNPACRATCATSDAMATVQPPSLGGREVCTYAASDVGVPTNASHVARWVAVTSAAKVAVWRIGKASGRTA